MDTNFVYFELLREEKQFGRTYDPQVLQNTDQSTVTVTIPGPLETLIQNDLIEQALRSLTEEDQLILRLHFFQDLPWKSIRSFYLAQGDSASESALRKRHSRAYERLLRRFEHLLRESD